MTEHEMTEQIKHKFEVRHNLKVTQIWFNSDPISGKIRGFGCGLTNQNGAEFIYDSEAPEGHRFAQVG